MNCGQSPCWPGVRIWVTGRHRRSAAWWILVLTNPAETKRADTDDERKRRTENRTAHPGTVDRGRRERNDSSMSASSTEIAISKSPRWATSRSSSRMFVAATSR